MNYLAHAALSFNMNDVLAGNMISDHVKGQLQYTYPPPIQVGIQLHRAIDLFTDQHESSKVIMNFFRPVYRLYSAAFTDIVYDYFLANDPSEFDSAASLENFSLGVYSQLDAYLNFFPPGFAAMYPYMKQHNWLYNYRLEEGILKSFGGLVRRATYLTECAQAFDIFLKHKEQMREAYTVFYPSVKNFATHTLRELTKA